MPPRKQTPKPKATREAFFVRVLAGDGSAAFFDASEHIGRVMPFQKPQATCAMRVAEGVVAFSLLHLTKKTGASIAEKPISIPRGPLARLERRAVALGLPEGEIVVEISERRRVYLDAASDTASDIAGENGTAMPAGSPAEAGLDALFAPEADTAGGVASLFEAPSDETPSDAAAERPRYEEETLTDVYTLKIRRDENGVATIDDDAETVVELPKSAARVTVYMRSPVVPRMLAIGFIGHLGRPGNPETVARMAGMVLNSLSHLTEFRLLSGIETVALGASPAKAAAPARPRQADERAAFSVRGYFFDTAGAPLGQGDVVVEIDLEHANPTSGRLLCSYTPEPSVAEAFESCRAMFDTAVATAMRALLGDEQIQDVTLDIVLGGVDASTVGRLRDAGRSIGGVDCSPTQFRPHQ
jgi:hypothetical protein